MLPDSGISMRPGPATLSLALVLLAACTEAPISAPPPAYTSFPAVIDPQCRDGSAKLYDECGDQVELFNAALKQAGVERKVLLVEVGAEWCIWCHVFDAHINGQRDRFRYSYGYAEEPDERYSTVLTEDVDASTDAAGPLREFVAEHFVIARIDIEHAPRGQEVLELTGASEHYPGGIPFVYVVDAAGSYVAEFNHDAVKRSRNTIDWYRGYDRIGLLAQLKTMHAAAMALSGTP